MTSTARPRRTRILKAALTGAAIVAIVWAFVTSLDEAQTIPWPSTARLLLAGTLHVGAVVAAWFAWTVLLGSVPARTLAPGFFLAQIAKYIPGSVWQGLGQILDAERHGVGRGQASLAFLLQLGTQVVAGALLGLLTFVAPTPMPLRLLAAGLGLSVLGIHRRWLAMGIAWLAQRVSRLRHLPASLPSSGRILAAVGSGVVTLSATATAFYALLPAGPSPLVVVGVFALAWTAGFLVLPLPSGLGVREFVLVAGLAGTGVETAEVLAVSIVLRVVVIAVDGLAAGASQLARRAISDR